MYLICAVSALSVLCFLLTADALTNNGQVKITESGSTKTLNVAGGNCGVTASGDTSVSLAQNCAPNIKLLSSTSSYYRLPNMMGKSIRFTVDLSDSNYGCNAAFYLFEAPSTANADYYCDAQCPSSKCCNEIDIMEANRYAFQTTAHCSTANTNACQWGCTLNWVARNGNTKFGPGSGYTIDTRYPFTVTASFKGSSSTVLSSINIKIVQGSDSISGSLTDSSCSSVKANYISGLSSSVTGGKLVLSVSYWHGAFDGWMDYANVDKCSTSSSNLYKVSNIRILNYIATIGEDESTASAAHAVAPMLYGVIALGVVVVVLSVIVVVVVIKKRSRVETV